MLHSPNFKCQYQVHPPHPPKKNHHKRAYLSLLLSFFNLFFNIHRTSAVNCSVELGECHVCLSPALMFGLGGVGGVWFGLVNPTHASGSKTTRSAPRVTTNEWTHSSSRSRSVDGSVSPSSRSVQALLQKNSLSPWMACQLSRQPDERCIHTSTPSFLVKRRVCMRSTVRSEMLLIEFHHRLPLREIAGRSTRRSFFNVRLFFWFCFSCLCGPLNCLCKTALLF